MTARYDDNAGPGDMCGLPRTPESEWSSKDIAMHTYSKGPWKYPSPVKARYRFDGWAMLFLVGASVASLLVVGVALGVV